MGLLAIFAFAEIAEPVLSEGAGQQGHLEDSLAPIPTMMLVSLQDGMGQQTSRRIIFWELQGIVQRTRRLWKDYLASKTSRQRADSGRCPNKICLWCFDNFFSCLGHAALTVCQARDTIAFGNGCAPFCLASKL